MRCSGWTRSIVAALVVATGCGLATGAASAFPANLEQAAGAVEPIVQRVAHKHNQWHWHGAWWRHGPWADHAIEGVVIASPWTRGVGFHPWGAHRLSHCAAHYRSFDPATGTYVTSSGKRRICR